MTLRDDIVFIIFLIQAYIYRVDKKRANEFGYVYEVEEKKGNLLENQEHSNNDDITLGVDDKILKVE